MQKICIFTGNPSYSVRKGIAEICASRDDIQILVVIHSPSKPLSKLLRNQILNIKRHGWRWIPYQFSEIVKLILGRSSRPQPLYGTAPGKTYDIDSLKQSPKIEFFATQNIHNQDTIEKINSFAPKLGISLAAPILKPSVFDIPTLGTINLHKGKVPYYRGMPPAFWELWNDENTVGCTIHKVDAGLDTGDILIQKEIPIHEHATLKGLQIELDELGVKMTCDAIETMLNGQAEWRPQESCKGHTYRRPTLKQEKLLQLKTSPHSRDSALKKLLKNLYFYTYTRAYRPLPRLLLSIQNRQNVIVLLYHRVNDELRDSVTVGVEQFDRQMAYIKNNYPIASIENIIKGDLPRNTKRPVICVTFDDGYRDNYDYAVPILLKHQIPAAFFVSTGMIGQERGFQHDIDKLGRALPNMDWSQITEMKNQGFTIGSHTVSHLNCGHAPLDQIRAELLESKNVLQEKLALDEVIFAYPFGKKTDFSPQALNIVKELGYVACLSAYGGINKLEIDQYNVLRTGIDFNFSDSAFQAKAEGY